MNRMVTEIRRKKGPASVNRRALLSSVFGNGRDARRVDAGAS
jgi:hypothetical protein